MLKYLTIIFLLERIRGNCARKQEIALALVHVSAFLSLSCVMSLFKIRTTNEYSVHVSTGFNSRWNL